MKIDKPGQAQARQKLEKLVHQTQQHLQKFIGWIERGDDYKQINEDYKKVFKEEHDFIKEYEKRFNEVVCITYEGSSIIKFEYERK